MSDGIDGKITVEPRLCLSGDSLTISGESTSDPALGVVCYEVGHIGDASGSISGSSGSFTLPVGQYRAYGRFRANGGQERQIGSVDFQIVVRP